MFFLCYFIYQKNNIRILRHSVVFHREFSFFQSHFLSWRKNSKKQYRQQYEQLREKEDSEKRAEKKRNGGRKKVRLRGVIGPALVRFTAVCVDSFFLFWRAFHTANFNEIRAEVCIIDSWGRRA